MTALRDELTLVDRRLGRIIAWCGILSTVAAWSRILPQTPEFAPWWTLLAAVPVLGIVVLAVAGATLSAIACRVLWTTTILSVTAAQVTVFLGYRGDDADGLRPWIGVLGPIAVCLMPLLVRSAVATVALAAVIPFAMALSGLIFLGAVPATALAMTPIHVGNIAVLAAVMGARARLLRLERAEESIRRLESRRDRAQERLRSQRAVARIVHDEVLSVLTAAMRLPGPALPEVRQAASAGLDALRTAMRMHPGAQIDVEREMEVEDAGQALARVAHGIAADADLSIAMRAGTVPAAVLERSSLALGEALRNSVLHARNGGPAVSVEVGGDELTLVVSDRGPGFDPDDVAPERMGLRNSILERMRDLPGGTADVTSGAGGTRVELGWRRAAARVIDSGLSTRIARVAVATLWVTGIVQSLLVGQFPVPNPAVGIGCYLVALLGALMVTAQHPGRLRGAEAAAVIGCAVVVALCVLAYADIFDAPAGEVWLLTFASYLVALVAARGNPAAGCVGAVLLVGLVAAWGSATGQPAIGVVAMATPTVVSLLVGVTWFIGVSRISVREYGVRSAAVEAASATVFAAAERWSSRRELSGIRRTAQPLLTALASGADIDDALIGELAAAEGSIRDRIRAPGLHHPALVAAVDAARRRGVHVLLLGEETATRHRLPGELATSIARLVAEEGSVAVTVREVHRGGGSVVTVVRERGDGSVQREEFSRAGA
ncbi:sensor histidine kinase [Microbacterium sp. NPDC057944]|uniref:ATP-binding protein n=1 Tax=Microbacterium sp. NPDC057944 TaxID=3346286 RepID=UPI0036DDCDDC